MKNIWNFFISLFYFFVNDVWTKWNIFLLKHKLTKNFGFFFKFKYFKGPKIVEFVRKLFGRTFWWEILKILKSNFAGHLVQKSLIFKKIFRGNFWRKTWDVFIKTYFWTKNYCVISIFFKDILLSVFETFWNIF